MHVVSQENNGRVSVLSYGFGTESGYGYLAGLRLRKPGDDGEQRCPLIYDMNTVLFHIFMHFASCPQIS